MVAGILVLFMIMIAPSGIIAGNHLEPGCGAKIFVTEKLQQERKVRERFRGVYSRTHTPGEAYRIVGSFLSRRLKILGINGGKITIYKCLLYNYIFIPGKMIPICISKIQLLGHSVYIYLILSVDPVPAL